MSLFAAFYDFMMRRTEQACLGAWRAELLRDLEGEVLEIGAGTGANLPYYGKGVTRLVLSEPDRAMRSRLASRTAEVLDAPAESLPLPDASVDVVVSTLVLCSVADPERAVAEARRVLRPGGRLVFLEHVAADDPGRLAWQRRLDPIWSRLAGGCRLARRTVDTIAAAGFVTDSVVPASMRKAPPFCRPTVRGVARKLGGGNTL